MKPINNNAIKRAYLRFSGYLVLCVVISVFAFFSFIKTASAEIRTIVSKTAEYDRIYAEELGMVASFDSIYQYMKLINTSPKINDVLLQNMVSARKMQLQRRMNDMNDQDYLLYKKLLNEMNVFMSVKDSIRIAEKEENMIRVDLSRSVKEYKDVSRKLKVGEAYGRN